MILVLFTCWLWGVLLGVVVCCGLFGVVLKFVKFVIVKFLILF